MVSKIDASGATGGVTVNASGQWQPVEFLGSRGNDFYIGALHPDTINAGRGSDVVVLPNVLDSDRLIFSAGDSTLSSGPQRTHDLIMAVGNPTGIVPTIDLSPLGLAGPRTAAIADKGILADSAVNGTTLFQPGWFISGGSAHAVAVGTRPLSADPIELPSQWRGLVLPTSTYVFVDVNKSGDFEASSDLFIEIAGVGQMSLANFVF